MAVVQIESDNAATKSMSTVLACEAGLMLRNSEPSLTLIEMALAYRRNYTGTPLSCQEVLQKVQRYSQGYHELVGTEQIAFNNLQGVIEDKAKKFSAEKSHFVYVITKGDDTVSVTSISSKRELILFDVQKRSSQNKGAYFHVFDDASELVQHLRKIWNCNNQQVTLCVLEPVDVGFAELPRLDVSHLQRSFLMASVQEISKQNLSAVTKQREQQMKDYLRLLESKRSDLRAAKRFVRCKLEDLNDRLQEATERKMQAEQRHQEELRNQKSEASRGEQKSFRCPPEPPMEREELQQQSSSILGLSLKNNPFRMKQQIRSQLFRAEAGKSLLIKKEPASSQPTACTICADDVNDDNIFIISGCEHRMCRTCAHDYVMDQILSLKIPITCPVPGCKVELLDYEPEFVLNEEEIGKLYRAYRDAAIKGEAIHCPVVNCTGLAIVVPPNRTFICPVCFHQMCAGCRQEVHEGDCDEAANAENEKLMKDLKLQKCSQCGAMVQKTYGCNHMTCRCGHEFCYICGRKVKLTKEGGWMDGGHTCEYFNEEDLIAHAAEA